NCRNLTGLPLEMLTQLPDIQALNIANNQNIPADRLKADWEAIINGSSGNRIQILYLGNNSLKEFPEYVLLSKMEKLGYIECAYSQVETVHPFGGKINLAQVILDHNKIRKIEPAPDGYFCGYEQMESFTASYNELTEAPDIFNARSLYEFSEVDFSHNKITGFANGSSHRGYNATTINLSYNNFSEFPSQIFKAGSPCQYLIFAGNGIREIKKGAFTGPKTYMLMSLDLSYNKLKELPSSDFYARNLPYLYGVDLSYNCFDYFPTEVLDGKGVTVFALRHQRDEEGNRTLKSWPTGLYANCPSLQALYLASNDIGKVGDTITNQILILELKDNPNITLNISASACAYYQYGYMLFVYDKTQDIRGCPAMLQ
ncbi:MAG: hypothetical protein HUJ94_07860, partial [Bacteroidales bacterium]|nr:hypothetical protein [Bacteroidales bacterium]